MPIRKPLFPVPAASEITPRAIYERRREFLKLLAAGTAAAWIPDSVHAQGKLAKLPGAKSAVPGATVADKVTSYKDITTYNNFYEFGTEKDDPVAEAHRLRTRPWTVSIEGEVRKPGAYDVEKLLKLAPMEERI